MQVGPRRHVASNEICKPQNHIRSCTFKSPSGLLRKSQILRLLSYQAHFWFDALSIFSQSQALHRKSQLFLRTPASEAPESARLSSSGGLERELLSYRARFRGNHRLSWLQLTYQILSRLNSQTGTLAAQSILLPVTSTKALT